MRDPAPRSERRVPTGEPDGRSPARLVVMQGDRPGRQHLLDDGSTIIGRALDCQLRFDDSQLSRHHAVIRPDESGRLILEDLDSSNGTFVNGAPVKEATAVELGDRIQLGRSLVLQLTLHDAVQEELSQRQRLEMIGRLGTGIAHDFNNMLAAVLSNVEYLSHLDADTHLGEESVAETLDDVRVAALRAADLSHRLVAFAQGQSSTKAIVDASQVCEEVARLVSRTFPRTIEIETDIVGRLAIEGSSLELHQILMNLSLNARDAMPEGGKLGIRARPTEGDGRPEITIEVSDEGEGMDEAMQRRIFEPFFTTKREKGFGVGLATVSEIVTYLGGGIDVTSVPGAGTMFELRFPRVQRHRHRRATSSLQPTTVAVPPRIDVLLVDDDDMVRRSTTRVLRRAGHEVSEAASGREALASYERGTDRPDLVLLDLDMPDLGGEAVLEGILTHDPGAAVVVVTGHHDEDRERELERLGAREVLRKPLGPGELLDCVTRTVTVERS